MNWLAHPVSAAALAGVQGRILDRSPTRLVASVSAAPCRFPASSVPITLGCRNGKALLLRSSDSPGTSVTSRLVSPNRSRTVFRYSREVRRRSGSAPAAAGSAVPLDAPVPDDAPAPEAPILPVHPSASPIAHASAPSPPSVGRRDGVRR
jgi:hypothetical protein